MHTMEGDRSRLAQGLQDLRPAIGDANYAHVTLRSLTNPALAYSADDTRAFDEETWLGRAPLAADPPPVALMSTDEAHWLLSDGGSTSEWSRRAPLERVIAIGRATENTGMFRVAARRSVKEPGALDVLISVVNQGRETARRDLVVHAGSTELRTRTVLIAPGESVHERIEITGRPQLLTASLQPGDALPTDDTLTLDTQPLAAIPVFVDPACPAALQRAVDAHVALRRNDEGNALKFLCSAGSAGGPAVRFHVGNPATIESPPAWLPAAAELQSIELRAAWIGASAWPDGTPAGTPLLLAGDKILVVQTSGHELQSTIDPGDSVFTGQPEYAAFVAGLVDLALGRPVLDPVAQASRDPVESDVEPRVLQAANDVDKRTIRDSVPLSGILLVIALSLLLFDLIVVARARLVVQRA